MKNPPIILYYSYAFLANHGGRMHSEAFLKEAQKSKRLNEILVYPTPSSKISGRQKAKDGLRKKLKNSPLLQVVFFYRRNYQSLKAIVPVLRKNEVDCLHIRVDSNFLIIERLQKLFPNLLITTEVNASPFDENFKNIGFSKYFKGLERRSLKKADANFFVSGFLRKRIMKEVVDTRDFVVYNGVDLDMFKTNLDKKESDVLTFGYVGTIDYNKNFRLLIDAFEVVHQKFPNKVELLIVGDGPLYKKICLYVEEKKLSGAVEFTGWVEHKDILYYLNNIDVAVHHSAKPYMSPLKIFEYMAVGLPVIGPDIPAVREVFKDGDDLLLVKNEIGDIVEKMTHLAERKDVRERIGRIGQEKIRSRFGWDKTVDVILSVIQKKYNENN